MPGMRFSLSCFHLDRLKYSHKIQKSKSTPSLRKEIHLTEAAQNSAKKVVMQLFSLIDISCPENQTQQPIIQMSIKGM